MKYKNIVNQQFNRWTATEYLGNSEWQCKCICGKIGKVLLTNLTQGKSTGCCQCSSHARKYYQDNLIGKVFFKWTVIKYVEVNQRKVNGKESGKQFLCRCSCGREKLVTKSSLTQGRDPLCDNISHRCVGDINKRFFNTIKGEAVKRELEFNINIEQAWELFIKQDKRCALSGVPIKLNPGYRTNKESQTASLDRIDSSKGYAIDNVQWVHKDLNIMKQDMPENEFFNWIKTILDHQKEKPPITDGFNNSLNI